MHVCMLMEKSNQREHLEAGRVVKVIMADILMQTPLDLAGLGCLKLQRCGRCYDHLQVPWKSPSVLEWVEVAEYRALGTRLYVSSHWPLCLNWKRCPPATSPGTTFHFNFSTTAIVDSPLLLIRFILALSVVSALLSQTSS